MTELGQAPTILTIDDDDPIRASFRFFLEDRGFAVIDAADGREGLAQALMKKPDLVLLDLRIPELGGLEVLNRLNIALPFMPVIVISGTGAIDDVVAALRCGAADYLVKPITDMKILELAVGRALERARLLKNERDRSDLLEREVKLRTADLAASEAKYRRIFESLQDVYCEVLPNGVVAEASPSINGVLGYRSRDVIGRPLWRLGVDRDAAAELFQILCDDGRVSDYELTLRDRDGGFVPCAISANLERDARGRPIKISGILRDIGDRKQAEAEIAYRAYHDDLTGLPNRALLKKRLDRAICGSDNDGNTAVLFFDLDHFKTINDSLSHAVGDALLCQVADRLRRLLRPGDLAARPGGDEFVVLLGGLGGDPRTAAAVAGERADRLRAALAEKYLIDDYELYVTPSIGLALVPADALSTDDALKFADTAMYRAKAGGRNAVCRYQPAMQQTAHRRLRLEQQLREALDGDQFELHFQPQFDAAGVAVGAEALLRWRHPQRGLIGPGEFISVAEESGLVIAIGEWALTHACERVSRWQRRGLLGGCRQIAVNVSPRQFQQADLVERIQRLLRRTDVDPALIKLELTEQVMIENLRDTVTKMNALRALGLGFAIDDFGTGYSSLAYLRKLPLDTIKIDRSFVNDIGDLGNGAIIVDTIIAMAHHLRLTVIAEGVESAAELEFLAAKGCNIYQGYYFSEPLSADAFTALLTAPIPTPARLPGGAAG